MKKVDQVAKAIADYWLSDGFDPGEPSEGAARAAIAAMRVLTEEMVDAARVHGDFTAMDCKNIWTDMLDEALK